MWTVLLSARFESWLSEQEQPLQEKMLAGLRMLKIYGPDLPRPYADTLNGSRYKNMKELRVHYSGRPIRAFYALILSAALSCCVRAIRVRTNVSTAE